MVFTEHLRKDKYDEESLIAKVSITITVPMCRVGKGVSAQASHRTVLDSLPSHGS